MTVRFAGKNVCVRGRGQTYSAEIFPAAGPADVTVGTRATESAAPLDRFEARVLGGPRWATAVPPVLGPTRADALRLMRSALYDATPTLEAMDTLSVTHYPT